MNSKVWTQPEFLLDFITLYKSRPCLWKVKNEDYNNRLVKDDAYNELLALCRKSDLSVGIEFVKSKINSVRTSYRKELCKINKSIQSGTGKIYVPKLWYFNLLDFLREQDGLAICRNPNYTNDEIKVEVDIDEQSFEDTTMADEDEGETDTECDQTEEVGRVQSNLPQITFEHSNMPNYKTKFVTKSKLSSSSNVDEEQDEFDALGVYVIRKLAKMERLQQLFAENLINKALFLGSMGQLAITSDIYPINSYNPQHSPSSSST